MSVRARAADGFVCTGEGLFIAHGGSPAFIGQTLSSVVAQTNNHLTDAAALLERFTTAARLGGGFVEYPWRNSPDAPLLVKGAHIMRVEVRERHSTAGSPSPTGARGSSSPPQLGSACTSAAAALHGGHKTTTGSYQNLAALAAAAGQEQVEPTAALATAGGRARTLFCGVGYFGGVRAARQPTRHLRSKTRGRSRLPSTMPLSARLPSCYRPLICPLATVCLGACAAVRDLCVCRCVLSVRLSVRLGVRLRVGHRRPSGPTRPHPRRFAGAPLRAPRASL